MLKFNGTLICDNSCDNSIDKYASVPVSVHMNGIYSSISILPEDMPDGWTIYNGRYICPSCSNKE